MTDLSAIRSYSRNVYAAIFKEIFIHIVVSGDGVPHVSPGPAVFCIYTK
jgi:hypothetical protein